MWMILADACIFFFKKKTKQSLINIGTGNEKKIIDYVNFLKKKMNYNGKIVLISLNLMEHHEKSS
jgi:GDP-L-fucose synthase